MDQRSFDALAVRLSGRSRRGLLVLLAAVAAGLGSDGASARGDGAGKIGDRCNTGHDCGKALACKGKRCVYKRGCGPVGASCRNAGDCCSGGTCKRGRCRRP